MGKYLHTIFIAIGLTISANAQCPPDNELTRGNVEWFIVKPGWEDARIATGTNGLTVSQLQVLSDDQDLAECEHFNTEFSDTINETNSEIEGGGPAYHVVYYKAGSFYFVSIVIAQPPNPEYHAVGLSFIIIYDNNLNRIEGYSF